MKKKQSKSRSKSNSDTDYTVERILDKRINDDGVIEYFLKWQDYDESFNTWEPIGNLMCDSLVTEFEENLRASKPGQSTSKEADGVVGFGDDFESHQQIVTKTNHEQNAFDNSIPSQSVNCESDSRNDNDESGVRLNSETMSSIEIADKRTHVEEVNSIQKSGDKELSDVNATFDDVSEPLNPSHKRPSMQDDIKSKKSKTLSQKTTTPRKSQDKSMVNGDSARKEETVREEPEKILGLAMFKNNEMQFLIKMKNKKKPIRISVDYAKEAWPLKVIEYYETLIRWQDE
ncbi:chromobox protein 1-like isoform X3 [Dinothrombium tinctorium]|uniref:Chromobox protein 1-like isoform X3 n=1 Tax=Dinothrombium tinctorium TaxID=1965070 RepID=A0A443RFN2_9ACAR|nr:chromobox protein 1-like isoform X3 [Dinothrombium tinctorium]